MLKEFMDIFSENGLFWKSNERLKNGRNVAVIQLVDGPVEIYSKVRYGSLPTGELDLSDFAEKFADVVKNFNTDDVAVRIYTSYKKNKKPTSLLTAINDAKIAKNNMFRASEMLLEMLFNEK